MSNRPFEPTPRSGAAQLNRQTAMRSLAALPLGRIGLLATLCIVRASFASVLVFDQESLSGHGRWIDYSTLNLAEGTKAAPPVGPLGPVKSAKVYGRWELSEEPAFRGHCVTLEDERYNSLEAMGLNRPVLSIRELGPTPAVFDAKRSVDYADRIASARAVVYAEPDLLGSSLAIDGGGTGDIKAARARLRGQSLRVEAGAWIFCSAPHFAGSCRTLGPGVYRRLPRDLREGVLSARAIKVLPLFKLASSPNAAFQRTAPRPLN